MKVFLERKIPQEAKRESLTEILINYIDKLDDYDKKDAYSNLIKAIKGTDLENETAFKIWKEKNPTFKDRIRCALLPTPLRA